MTKRPHRWTVRLAAAAEADFRSIVAWTVERFGARQAGIYASTLSATIRALASGPKIAGVKARDDILRGVLTLHVARRGRKGRHFVVFRIAVRGGRVIEVLRILHDAMDLQRHVDEPPADD